MPLQVTGRRLWKNVYDELGGSPGSTSAATCTRRHYERYGGTLPFLVEDTRAFPFQGLGRMWAGRTVQVQYSDKCTICVQKREQDCVPCRPFQQGTHVCAESSSELGVMGQDEEGWL
jgi:hypothetical protein